MCTSPLDIVFVLDVSTSMENELQAVERGLEDIWCSAVGATESPQFSLVVFVDEVLLVDGCKPFEDLESFRGMLASAPWKSQNGVSIQPRTGALGNAECAENTLGALQNAVVACPWREGSQRLIVHITDDSFYDSSRPQQPFGQRTTSRSDIPQYDETVNALRGKGIKVGSFAVRGPSECSGGRFEEGDAGAGIHLPWVDGSRPIPAATGGQAWDLSAARDGNLDMTQVISTFIRETPCSVPILE